MGIWATRLAMLAKCLLSTRVDDGGLKQFDVLRLLSGI
jgi:hypothetical protein